MKTVTVAQMQAIDRRAIDDYGIPGLLLMENAGRGIAEMICNNFKVRNVTIFAGAGNNGGDGFVIARHLANRGFSVCVMLFAGSASLKDDPAVNFQILQRMKIPCQMIGPDVSLDELMVCAERADLLVDALFGIGLTREITGIHQLAVTALNEAARNIVSVDIPSGLNSDTGEILGSAVKATVTATLCLPKSGLFKGQGPEHAGRVCVIDIGIPPMAIQDVLGSVQGRL
jgi:NAD(P)H-hydrate epimerase